ncbi:MAG TPA: AAA family ATPase [Bacteroidales bacterium]|nr:AAA family ATPase [Bacteroidales bacterium]
MKIKKLTIKNIGPIESMEISPNAPLNIFYGDIRTGKTTILNAVKLCFGGSFPSDVINHDKQEASVEMIFDNASIRRSFYRNNAGETISRPIEFINEGILVQKPVEEIKKFLNPFLLDQNYLLNMTETERKKYFTQLFDIDTEALDSEYKNLEDTNREIRATIKGYGEIIPVPVEPVNTESITMKKKALEDVYNKERTRIEEDNKIAAERMSDRKNQAEIIMQAKKEIDRLQETIKQSELWMEKYPDMEFQTPPPPPDEINNFVIQLSEAAANNVRFEQYIADKKRLEAKNGFEEKLHDQEKRQKAIKKEKAEKLQVIDTKIKDLSFDKEGNIIFQETFAGMLSTSQIMTLSNELSSLYPPGFGLSLIDRGESLGKSIFGFIEEAKRDNKVIFSTVVGDKPADIPDDVGVYVIEDGRIKAVYKEDTPL